MKQKGLFSIFIIVLMAMIVASCSNEDNAATPVVNLQAQWITNYAKAGTTAGTGDAYNRVVEVYEFYNDGKGYFERYLFNGDKLISSEFMRDGNGDFTYTQNGNVVNVTLEDKTSWHLNSGDGFLTDSEGHVFAPSTNEQKVQILNWYDQMRGGSDSVIWDINSGDGIGLGKGGYDGDIR